MSSFFVDMPPRGAMVATEVGLWVCVIRSGWFRVSRTMAIAKNARGSRKSVQGDEEVDSYKETS